MLVTEHPKLYKTVQIYESLVKRKDYPHQLEQYFLPSTVGLVCGNLDVPKVFFVNTKNPCLNQSSFNQHFLSFQIAPMEVASVCGNHHLFLGATLQQPNNLEPTILSPKFIHSNAMIFTPTSRHHNIFIPFI